MGADERTTEDEVRDQATPEAEPAAAADDINEEDLEAQLAYENLKRRREARKRKRIVIIAIIAAIALIGGMVYMMGQANKAADEEEAAKALVTATAYRGDFSTTVSAKGATEPLKSTIVTPEVDGIIENLEITEGSFVTEGDVIFTLKNESLDKAVREASAQVQSGERSVNNAQTAVDNAYNAYNKAWNEAAQANDWSTFDEAALKGAITSAESTLEDAKLTLETARASFNEALSTAEKRNVRAPVSGNVVSMSAQNGMGVGAAAGQGNSSTKTGPLLQISDLTQMKVTVQVNEIDIANVHEGQTAVATFSALPDLKLDAIVQRIASVSTGSGESSGGVVTYAVDLLIPNPDPALKPGMTATVTITTQSAPGSLIVPTAAIVDDGGGKHHVTVLVDKETNETKDVPVEIVVQNNSEAAVAGDLKDGDAIVLGAGGAGDAEGAGEHSPESA